MTYDVVFRRAMVVDGTGGPAEGRRRRGGRWTDPSGGGVEGSGDREVMPLASCYAPGWVDITDYDGQVTWDESAPRAGTA